MRNNFNMVKNKTNIQAGNTPLFQNKQIEEDFRVELSDRKLPFVSGILRVQEAIVCICLNGEIRMTVDRKELYICRNTFLVLFPGQIVGVKAMSENLEVMYFTVSAAALTEVLFRFPPEFTTFFKEQVICHDSYENIKVEMRRFEMLKSAFDDRCNVCRRDIILNLVRVYYLELYNSIYKLLNNGLTGKTRKMELFEQFARFVMEDYRINREVLFYANKLNISVKYLSMVVLEMDGRNAKKWIDDYVISEIKIRLQSTNESLQDIAFDLNFSDQSFLSKYFKRKTGVSPTKYRKSVL